jgi:hypothetical protein
VVHVVRIVEQYGGLIGLTFSGSRFSTTSIRLGKITIVVLDGVTFLIVFTNIEWACETLGHQIFPDCCHKH